MLFPIEDDDTHLGESWTPTEEEFNAYRAREVELATANCEHLSRVHGMHAVRASNTLHTKHTIRDFVHSGPFKVPAAPTQTKNPKRVAMGTFMLGYQAMLAGRRT